MRTSFQFSAQHLPQQLVPFVGRETEVTGILNMLDGPACRLLTVIGSGGMGKTRLALRIAELVAESFAAGCYWVDLQALQSHELLLQAVLDVFGLAGSNEPLVQISSFLKDKQLLLIFDNFEHVLDGAPLLTKLLTAAPQVKMLVTSREALNLHEEWVHHLEGLPYPAAGDVENAESFPAVQLFVQSAKRALSSFEFDSERQAVVQICRYVGGLPLALELAAAWTRSLSCPEIATEIQGGLELLTARTRNIPQRHQSMRVVFEQTCTMLLAEEHAVFKRLSIFRGGFQREAAVQIAGATVPVLTTLIDKSLISYGDDGRYYMHELVRQYADEQLKATPDEDTLVYRRHSAYYMQFLRDLEDEIMGAAQKHAVAAIRTDLDNIRLAWNWAIDHAEIENIQKAATTFAEYCQIQSRYLEAADIFERASQIWGGDAESIEETQIQVLIQAYQSGFYLRVGRVQEAEQVLKSCEANYKRLAIPPVPGFTTDPAFNLGILALIRGDYALALDYGERMRYTSETQPHHYNRQLAYHLLAEASIGLGHYQAAQQYANQSFSLLKEVGNRWFMAYAYNQLGMIASALEDYGAAQRYFETSYGIRDEFDDLEGMALALRHLGEIMLEQQNYADARERFEESLTIYNDLHDRGGFAQILTDLARLDLVDSDYPAASQRLKQALEIAADIQFISLIQTILIVVAELLLDTGLPESGVMLLAAVGQQPILAPQAQQELEQLVASWGVQLPPETDIEPLELAVDRLLFNFPNVSQAQAVDDFKPIPKFKQELIEPLTQREQEVLYYIAKGLSNREIAGKMYVSISTVKSHINNLYGKLGVDSREEAVILAQELYLL